MSELKTENKPGAVHRKKDNDVKNLPYPHNLFEDIKKGREHISFPEITADMEMGLFYAISHLSEREIDMLLMRYQHCATFGTIAKKYKMTNNRASQIISKAIRKLAQPSLRKIYQNGLRSYIDKTVNQIVEAKIAFFTKEEYERGYKEGYSDAEKERPSNPMIMQLKMPIEDLGLSARSFNALKRAGNNTVGDMLKYTDYKDILQIRNLGAASLTEIAKRLNEFGFMNEVWEFWL